MPVENKQAGLAQAIGEAGRNEAELAVKIVVAGGLQHLQAAFDGEAGSDDEEVAREAGMSDRSGAGQVR